MTTPHTRRCRRCGRRGTRQFIALPSGRAWVCANHDACTARRRRAVHPRRGRSVYAYLCTTCGHPASSHRLLHRADPVHGPYRCRFDDCTCEIVQTDPLSNLTRGEFTSRFPGYPRQLRSTEDLLNPLAQ